MDARTPGSDAIPDTDELKIGTEQKLGAYGRARRRRERIRKIVRGAIGIAVVLVLWHVMAVAYDLEQILPPPLSVARTVINTLTLNYDQRWLYGPKRITLLRRVILPASAPYIITGMRIALGGAWRMIVAGEMLASQSGIGSVLMESRYQFRATDLMMAMILISIVGYITERLTVGTLEKKTTERWEVKIL